MDYENGEVWIFPNISSEKQRSYYTKDSITHPAKMPTYLCQKIIKEYTKTGDVVLDPMAGIGTTGIEAILLGRNAIMVEYEKRFVSVIEQNLKRIEVFRTRMKGMGHAQVILGDARKLTELMKKVDSIIFSPPFANVTMEKKPSDKWKGPDFSNAKYSDNKENIGNLGYGKNVDAVVMSPPYGHQSVIKPGNLKYKNQLGKEIFKNVNYSFDPENIGNLRYPGVDAIVFSPPYGHESYVSRQNVMKGTPTSRAKFGYATNYSMDKDNIGNLTYADAVIFSPPFAHGIGTTGIAADPERHGKGGNFRAFAETPGSIESLSHKSYGNIDAIITSPPFEGNQPFQDKNFKLSAPSGRVPKHKTMTMLPGGGIRDDYAYTQDKTSSNLANFQGKSYLSEMKAVYDQCLKVLKPGGIMALVTKNFTRSGKIVRLDLDTIKLCESVGFKYKERKFRFLKHTSFWIKNARKKYFMANPNKTRTDLYAEWEDILVFEK